MKGQNLLKTCSVLMIFCGLFCLVAGTVSILGAGNSGSLASHIGIAASSSALKFAAIIEILGGAAEFSAGVVGSKVSAAPSSERVKSYLVIDIAVIALSLFSVIYAACSSAAGINVSVILIEVAISVVIPVLGLVGLLRFKKALDDMLNGK